MERRHLIVLILLLLGAAIVFVLFGGMNGSDSKANYSIDEIRNGEAPPPEMSEAVQAKLSSSRGFAALASYTENGFEPSIVEVEKGETVRFTNNSTQNMWLVTSGEKVAAYPRTKQGCGSSDLDSCGPIGQRDFWEFTFDAEGTWEVVNSLDTSKSLFVRVE